MTKNSLKCFIVFVLIFLLSACNTSNNNSQIIDATENNSQANSEQAYPPSLVFSEPTAYPADFTGSAATIAYPINTPTKDPRNGPEFNISEPVLEGSTQVSGTGPANVPIILIDVTEMGDIIAETTIQSNGEFAFDFSTPLRKGHAVGLQIGDLSRTNFNYDDFTYGENYIDKPLIGILLDMASVVEK